MNETKSLVESGFASPQMPMKARGLHKMTVPDHGNIQWGRMIIRRQSAVVEKTEVHDVAPFRVRQRFIVYSTLLARPKVWYQLEKELSQLNVLLLATVSLILRNSVLFVVLWRVSAAGFASCS